MSDGSAVGTRRGTRTDEKVSMRDVAAHAGVSVSTVSRVLNDGAYVDASTRERVQAAIGELGYRPNLLARGFRRSETRTIGLLVPDNTNPFFGGLARAIEQEGFAAGYSVVLCNSDLSPAKQLAYIDVLLAKQVDGLILAAPGLVPDGDEPTLLDRVIADGTPCVLVDRSSEDAPIDQVLVDQRQGGYDVGAYLTGLGHRRLACLVGPSDRTASAGRIAGFRQALADAGITLPPEAVVRGNGQFDGGEAAMETLLARGVDFTAVFAFNDLTAIGAIAALQRHGLRVPDDVSVVGFDDIFMATAVFPPLTTVAQPIPEVGRESVRLLLARIANRDAPTARVVMPTRFVERESCRAIDPGAGS